MKKIIYILLLSVFWSCDNLLDVEPENAITYTNFFQDEEDLNAITSQIHSYLSYKFSEYNHIIYRGFVADKVTNSAALEQRTLSPSMINNYWISTWKGHYDVIYVSNVLMDNLYRAENVAQDRKNFYLGQAYFAKGLAYFELVRKWGECVITKNSVTTSAYAKSGVLEVIDEAIRNAEEAYRLLPLYEDMRDLAGNILKSKQYACKGASAALLAHLYAWKGSIIDLCEYEGDTRLCYEKSIEWSTLLIDKKVGYYELEKDPEEVCTRALYGLDGSSEGIFEFQLDEFQDYPSSAVVGIPYLSWPVDETKTPGDIQNLQFAIKCTTVENMYRLGDKRRDAYFYDFDTWNTPANESVTGGFAYMYKWRQGVYQNVSWLPTPQWAYLKASYCYWRLADIYLLRAECYAKLNDERAIADLNKIRGRAGAALYPAASDVRGLQYAIFKEREKELLIEGHRYYDIVRNGLDYIHEFLDGNFKTLTLQEIKDGALYLPVSQDAFVLNDLMRQNRYWLQFE